MKGFISTQSKSSRLGVFGVGSPEWEEDEESLGFISFFLICLSF